MHTTHTQTRCTRAGPELVGKYVTPLADPNWDRGLLEFYKAQASEATSGARLMEEVRNCNSHC
jgi:hypothetical protein